MSSKSQNQNPVAFIAIGVCFMGAGIALSTALNDSGASGVGIGIIGIGVMFVLIGAARMRTKQSEKEEGEERD